MFEATKFQAKRNKEYHGLFPAKNAFSAKNAIVQGEIRRARASNECVRFLQLYQLMPEYWWKRLHKNTTFWDIIAEISRQFPLVQ